MHCRILIIMMAIFFLINNNVFAEQNALNKKIEGIINSNKSSMSIGMAYTHIESGKSGSVNGNLLYPLASVFKVPVMICIFQKIDQGKLKLSDKITLNESDKCIGGGNIQYAPAGSSFTISHLNHEMITISDNTATDLLWKQLPQDYVRNFMLNSGFKNSDIYIPNRPGYLIALSQGSEFKRKTGRQIAQIWRKKNYPQRKKSIETVLSEHKNLTLQQFQVIEENSLKTSTYRDDVISAEALDNISTPCDFTALFTRLYKRELLSEHSTRKTLATLARCKFNSRIPAKLPPETKVFHKTGTICGVVNDAGIIEISENSHVAVSVFIKNISAGSESRANNVIADISRLIYQEFKNK